MRAWKYSNLWNGCVGAWCPSQEASRSALLTDFSSRRINGTLTNMDPGTDWIGSGNGKSLDFDGTNDYVILSTMPVLSAPFSVSAWFRVRDVTAYRTIFCLALGSGNVHYWLLQTRGDIAGDPLEISLQAGGGVVTARTPNAIIANQWMHACLVEVSSTEHTCYLNGIGATATNSVTPSTPTRATIGAFFGSALDGYFNGQLDDVRVYNRALTLAEVNLLALRRGISFEQIRHRRFKKLTTASNKSGVNMLMGVTA